MEVEELQAAGWLSVFTACTSRLKTIPHIAHLPPVDLIIVLENMELYLLDSSVVLSSITTYFQQPLQHAFQNRLAPCHSAAESRAQHIR